jgi:hypothetical protein
MKNNLSFYKTILNNDLLIKNDSLSFKKFSPSVLDLYTFANSVKQLLRVLTFLTSKRKSLIYFFFKNKFLKNIFEKLMANLNKNLIIKASTFFPKMHKRNFVKLLIGFESIFYKSNLNLKKLFLNTFFLVSNINPNKENILNGKYKIFSDIKNTKHLSFFLSVLHISLKNKNAK